MQNSEIQSFRNSGTSLSSMDYTCDGKKLLVAGEDKADALVYAQQAPADINHHPTQAIQATDGEIEWLVDQAAANQLQANNK